LGGIYVVRDPRNVITSVKNHFSFDEDEAYNFMSNINTSIKKKNSSDYRTWVLLSSWANHYKSWVKSKNFRKLLIKYEDFEENKARTFRDIIIFVNTLLKNSEGVNNKKLERAIETTNFDVLKKKEKKEGFEESAYSNENKRKMFFNLGFNNRWKELLRKDIREKIEKQFYTEMNELDYL